MKKRINKIDKIIEVKMKKLIYLLPFLLIGCVTSSEVYINAQKDIRRCDSSGNGLSGLIQTKDIMVDCDKEMTYLGYVKLKDAGFIGITLNDSLVITNIEPISNLAYYKVHTGTILKAVNGKHVKTKTEAQNLLFGKLYSMLKVTISEDGIDSTYRVQRQPFSNIYGEK